MSLYPLIFRHCTISFLHIFLYIYVAPLISLSVSYSTLLIITLTAPTESSSLTYNCTITTTEMDISPKTVNDTELEYTVKDLRSGVNYTVECTSSNGKDSCDSNMDTIICKYL